MSRSCCFVSVSASQLRCSKISIENQLDITLVLVGVDKGLVPQCKLVMCETFIFLI